MTPVFTKLKKVFVVIVMFTLAFGGYVLIVNRNAENMTGRQKLLKVVYPLFVLVNKMVHKNTEILANNKIIPPVSFYSLKAVLNNGAVLDMASLKGKKVLLVNTASDCGYTGQYDQLQQLYSRFGTRLVVLGFPANDFKEQEKGTDEAIALFCKKNYGVDFPLLQKSIVLKRTGQNSVFKWLTEPAQNGWNKQAPTWNFSKYLVNETGMLTHYFGPAIEPTDETILEAIR
ncbi:MAG: glutathione peroxidase [Bacteroidota bacterium]